MGVGPPESPSRVSPADRSDTKSQPANAAPAADKPLPTNVTPGILAFSKSPASMKLDAAITRGLNAVKQATENYDNACGQLGKNQISERALESVEQKLNSAQKELNRHVKLALTARLPTFDRKYFDRQIDAIAVDIAAGHGDGYEIRHAIGNAKIEVEQELPDAQRAALIMERILNNGPPDVQFTALIKVYRDSGFKSEIRKDPGYQQIIDAKVQDCFVKKSSSIEFRPANVRAVVEDWRTHSDIKQDFLRCVVEYAKNHSIVLPDLELQALHSIINDGPI